MTSPRALSLELLRTDFDGSIIPNPGDAALVKNKEAALEEVKPLHYAKLAQTIGLLSQDIEEGKADREPHDLLHSSEYRGNDPWGQLRVDFINTFFWSIANIENETAFKETQSINGYIGALDPNRFINLHTQLLSGADTASNSMLTFLKNLPALAEHFGIDQSRNGLIKLASNSTGLPARLAMTCVNRMMGAQAALSINRDASWAAIDQILDPEQFKIVGEAEQKALLIKHFDKLQAPKGSLIRPERSSLEKTVQVGEIACYQSVIIGCPITLLRHQTQNLWNWFLEVVDDRNLWQL